MARPDIGDTPVTYDTEPRLWPLVKSDYARAFPQSSPDSLGGLLRLVVRHIINPGLQLAFSVRLAQCGPEWVQHPVRWLQIALFSSEIYWFRGDRDRIQIGPGIFFPHPVNVLMGGGTIIGSNVSIYNNTSIGSDRGTRSPAEEWDRSPAIADGATVYAYTTIQGPYVVGEDAKVGIWVMLTNDVPAGHHQTTTSLRPARRERAES